MAVDTDQIMQEAEKLGQLVAQHPAVARYKEAQKSVESDPDAGRLDTACRARCATLPAIPSSSSGRAGRRDAASTANSSPAARQVHPPAASRPGGRPVIPAASPPPGTHWAKTSTQLAASKAWTLRKFDRFMAISPFA